MLSMLQFGSRLKSLCTSLAQKALRHLSRQLTMKEGDIAEMRRDAAEVCDLVQELYFDDEQMRWVSC